jgi:predicted dehydrogenase
LKRKSTIRIGVVGARRGQSLAGNLGDLTGTKLVAICDTWEERLKEAGEKLEVQTFTDYEKFLSFDMDAVILANYFHQHAPFAIKALEAGFHVMSETAACKTLAEGVALCRAVEKSKRIYMFAENYPYNAANQQMARLYREGEIGRALYAEGEYNHPMAEDTYLSIAPGTGHWRNNLPSTYYCTHALAPLMVATDAMPVSVNALSIPDEEFRKTSVKQGDRGAVILVRTDGGAVFRLFQTFVPGHSIWYRIHGTHGLIEHVRGPGYWGPGILRIVHEEWDRKPGVPTERTLFAEFPELADQAKAAGHGGGDFYVTWHFAEAIRRGRQPYLDVYRGVAMSAVGILAWKSAMADGAPFPMPDFHREEDRKANETDRWSPFPEDAGPGQPPVSILGPSKRTAKALAHARKVWKESGYQGD